MYTWIGSLKWYWQAIITVVFIALVCTAYLFIGSRAYDKARREYEERDKVRAIESAKHKARADQLEKEVAELQPKVDAYEKLAEDKKRLDESISQKINQAVEDAKTESAITSAPTDCWDRTQRTCNKLLALKPPLQIDCEAYKKKMCAQPAVANPCPGQ